MHQSIWKKHFFYPLSYKKHVEIHDIYTCMFEYSKLITMLNKWKIVKIVYTKVTSSFCKLCLTEKLFIFYALGDDTCLNKKKPEFINQCHHQNKLLLKNLKDSMYLV